MLLTNILLPVQILFVMGAKNFHLGRSKGGNIGLPSGADEGPLPEAKWFMQKLDHTSPANLKTWKQEMSGKGCGMPLATKSSCAAAFCFAQRIRHLFNSGLGIAENDDESSRFAGKRTILVAETVLIVTRYFVNDKYFDKNNPGPVFLMIGGEGPADPKWMVKGAWIEYAKFFKALCINLEHRYYGESHPTEDVSTKNLQYLSSSQALDDIAYFIQEMNEQYNLPKDTKWVAFGGSYPGSLAAWVRVRYPHLVYGAVSSSGPLLAKVDFMEYFKVVVDALREKTGDEGCVDQVKLAHQQITALMDTQPDIIETEFKVCKKFSGASANDLKNFYNSIADDFADVVQYNEDNRIGAKEEYRNVTINTVCQLLTGDMTKPAYKRLAEFNEIILNKNNETCLDYSYDNMIEELRNVSWGSDEARQWMYQTCTEFGFYQTSSAEVEVFGNAITLDFYIQQCEDVFGKKFDKEFVTKAAEWTNGKYGGLDIAVSRVVFVHGSVDPWHALGITDTKDTDAPAIFIHGTAHCANMYPSAESDPPALKQARVEIQLHLAEWVGLP